MLNSEVFLQIFSEIEKCLRTQVAGERTDSFYSVIERASSANQIVRRYKDDLKEFADLRNAIVHERSDGHVIAEPNDRAISSFRKVRAALLDPPRVLPQFSREVYACKADDTIGKVVAAMRQGSFSQVPILGDGKVISLLTSETVVRWLGSEIENELVSLSDTRIAAVIEHREESAHYCFLPRSATLFDVLTCFEKFIVAGNDLDAILISHDGKADQAMLGILTAYDLPEILKKLGLRRVSTH
jgi:CBS domain-containing protein